MASPITAQQFARTVVSLIAIGYVALGFYAGWRAIGGDQAALEFLKAFWSVSALTALLTALAGTMFSGEIAQVLNKWGRTYRTGFPVNR
jgi:hypothetical protein